MDLSNPVTAVIPSLEGEVYRVLARTTAPLSSVKIALLAGSGSRQGIRLALDRLVSQGTVSRVPVGATVLYVANRDHLLWSTIEAAMHAADRVLVELKLRLAHLVQAHADPQRREAVTVALYGSVARGSSTPDSDIDVLAIFPSPGLTAADEDLIDEITAQVPRWTGNACNVYPLTRTGLSELLERRDPIIESWREDAETLTGPDLRALLGSRAETRA